MVRSPFLELRQDLRFAARVLRRQRLTTALTILCVALGVGATTSSFSVASALLLRPLPLPNGERLAFVGTIRSGEQRSGSAPSSYADYVEWNKRQKSFTELAVFAPTTFTVNTASPVRATGAFVSDNYFRALGVAPLSGRFFTAEEDRPGGAPVVVVARGFAERELGGATLNSVITIGGVARTVVGIAADMGPMNADVWVPIGRDPDYDRSSRNLRVLGALRDGATVQAAERELMGLMTALQADGATQNVDASTFVVPLRERYAGAARPALYAISAATLLVLLVTCANLAGIQLAQGASRGPEMAVRTAIGAGRARLFRQLVTESLLIAVVGGAAGLLISSWTSSLAARAVLGDAPAWLTPVVDWRVQLFAIGASALTGILFGIAPGIRLAKSDPAEVLRGGRVAASSRARVQRTFVVAQMALSVALIIAAGLSISSVARLQRVALGFDPDRVMTFSIGMQGRRYDDPAQRARLIADVEERLSAIPGVSRAGASSTIPLRPCCLRWNLKMDGVAPGPGRPLTTAGGSASAGYFATMGIALVEGRGFATSDDGASARVAVVNESFVRRFGKSVLGRQFDFGFGATTIVGIVRDAKQGSLVEVPDPYIYWPAAQTPTTFMSFVVKTEREDPGPLVASVRRVLQQADPSLPMGALRSMTSIIDEDTAARRTFKWLLVVFGAIGLMLVGMGIFAVTSFQVSQRLRELAIRVALGSTPGRVGALIFADVARLSVAGCAIGLGLGIVMARWLASTLYGVSWMEPLIYGAAVIALGVGSLAAAWWPVRRAMTAAPVTVLRDG